MSTTMTTAPVTPSLKEGMYLSTTPSSSRRRALCSPRSPFSPGSAFKRNNDRREKAMRRSLMKRSRDENKAFESSVTINNNNSLNSSRMSPRKKTTEIQQQQNEELSSVQLSSLYSNCIKMCSENKINQKNSWELPLIDYIADVTSTRPGELTNFQMASVTLDASVKIYSCRVDSIHSEAYKVLGGISRSDKKKTAQSDDVDDVDSDGNVKTKRKRHRAVNTLESNPDSLIVKKLDLEFDVDPLFKQMSAAFDEGGARGLLLNHLSTDKAGTLIFDSQEKDLGTEDTAEEMKNAIPDSAFTSLLSEWSSEVNDAINDTVICPTLSNFAFMGWTPDVSEGTDAVSSLNRSVFGENYNQHTHMNESVAADGNDLDVDMNIDGGSYELNDSDVYDGGFADVFDDTVAPSLIETTTIAQQQQANSIKRMGVVAANIATALTENAADSEYSYFNENAMKNWAGPNHWKFQKKPSKTGNGADENTNEKCNRKKNKKEKFLIDFEEAEMDWEHLFATSRAATILSKTTLKKSGDEYLLPFDAEYSIQSLTSLFTRPHLKVSSKKSSSSDYVVVGDVWYDYDNPNDANNFCPAQGVEGDNEEMDYDDFDGGDFNADDGEPWTQPTDTGDNNNDNDNPLTNAMGKLNLIAEPTKAQKIHIGYAKHAKRVNVRQVKSCIWKELKDTQTQQSDDENSSNNKGELVKNKKTEVKEPHDFSKLVKDVPALVPKNTGEQLSVPIMFVCLLHLANEKTLTVSSTEDMNELIIAQ
eukprot:m.160293 g.160293  ORF g.160293 m.160293 type:complete len:759 (+) comp13383_c3_seq3:81-2357(+)